MQQFFLPSRTTLAVIFIFIFSALKAQSTNDLMLGMGLDFVKTDNSGILEKAQLGFEGNFFVKRNFTVTVGTELWSNNNESFVFGTRWYFNDHIFSRFRGLIGENDFSIGLGGSIALTTNWRWEIIGDYYFENDFAVRTGIAYVIRL